MKKSVPQPVHGLELNLPSVGLRYLEGGQEATEALG
jgi:hypothetical protein